MLMGPALPAFPSGAEESFFEHIPGAPQRHVFDGSSQDSTRRWARNFPIDPPARNDEQGWPFVPATPEPGWRKKGLLASGRCRSRNLLLWRFPRTLATLP